MTRSHPGIFVPQALITVTGYRFACLQAMYTSQASGLAANPVAVIAEQWRCLPTADNTVADQALGPYRAVDHGVSPYGKALSGGEKRFCLPAGQCDGHHDTPAGLQRQLPIRRDHCGEVHAVTEGLEQAAVVRRESSHSAREAPRGTLTRRRIERDPSPEPVLPHRGHPSRPTRSVARWAGPATPAAGRPAQRHGYGLTNMTVAADNTC